MDKAVQQKEQAILIDIWKNFATIGSYLQQNQKLHLHNTSKAIKQLTSNHIYWSSLQITSQYAAFSQIKWVFRSLKQFNIKSLNISLRDVNEKFLVKMLTLGLIPSVECLDIYCESLDVHLACALSFPNLVQLTIRSRCVNNQLVQMMVSHFPNIRSLTVIKNDLQFTCKNLSKYMKNPMEKLIIKPYVIQFQEVQAITKNSQDSLIQLEIDMQQCSRNNIIGILQPLKKLQKLRLYHLQNLQSDEQLCSVLQRLDKIQELVITKIHNFPMNNIINIISSEYLLSLDITDSKYVNDEDIERLTSRCINLRDLNISWCNQVSCKGLSAVIRNCLNIERLIIIGVKQSRDIIFGEEYLSLLQHFDQEKFNHIKNEGFRNQQIKDSQQIYQPNYFFKLDINAMEQKIKKITKLRKLKFLDCNSCNGVSDNILKVIFVINPRVRVYNYYGNYMGLFPKQDQTTFC